MDVGPWRFSPNLHMAIVVTKSSTAHLRVSRTRFSPTRCDVPNAVVLSGAISIPNVSRPQRHTAFTDLGRRPDMIMTASSSAIASVDDKWRPERPLTLNGVGGALGSMGRTRQRVA
jgi:hypothetical protein